VERHKRFINDLLKEPKWRSTCSEGSADEIIEALKKSSEVPSLMDNIFALATEEGITAMTLSSDSLRNWILDIINTNNIKIVLLWDEFSDYFRRNSTSLGEFQKIVSICQEAPFYLVIVTHPFSSIAKSYDVSDKSNPWTVVQQRFERVEITLPDNIAFDLIGHAFNVKETAQSEWDKITGDFRTRVDGASKAVRKAANIPDNSDRIHSKDVMEKILPIQPMAALVLKNIASAFQSNQRSMFDFIKTRKEINGEGFQSFIQNNSPFSERPFLTVDMLWDFFYDKGKDNLSRDTRLILDTFQQHSRLTETEKIVLKTILIMQAIDQRLGGSLAILKPTEQNLSYAFEGEGALYRQSNNIAQALVRKGILIERPIEGGKTAYSTAVYAGDNVKIEGYKENIRKLSTTERLVLEGPALASLLDLSPALKLRFAQDVDSGNIPVVTKTNFKQVMDSLKSKDTRWRCYAVLALAKTDDEALSFRTLIQKTIASPEYKHILVIDALSSPLGLESLERYVEFAAMAEYYRDNDRQQSKEQAGKAKFILETDWKNHIVE
ncbi:MAG: hypothetical protein J6S75_06540, partial [Thermoguttaceae bacterium]|nr:hypothetical protein [Thermoguttaceae bacterium]